MHVFSYSNTKQETGYARIQKILLEGVQLKCSFFNVVDEGWEDPNTTISGPSSAFKEMPRKWLFRWHTDDGPTLNAGSGAL